MNVISAIAVAAAVLTSAPVSSNTTDAIGCLTHSATLDECLWFYAVADDVEFHANDITCPTTPIVSGAQINGNLDQHTSCRVTVPTSLGSVQDIADVYSFTATPPATVTVSLVSPDATFFGLPYIALINSAGTFVKVVIGLTSDGNGFRADLSYTIPAAGQWRLLVTGVGGQFSTAVGSYSLTFKMTVPSKRRAVRKH